MAFQSPLIALPKKTTADVDWAGPLRATIAHSYGESPDAYAEECSVLQRCRQDAVRGAGSDQTARDLLYKYFGQLELLELRFAEVKVSFGWNDAFTHKLTTQTSLAFEKASIIHLLASVLSSLAASQSRADPEGAKRAYFNLRASAGMLTYINENFLHAPSTDLSREVVHFAVGVMLAQATEVFCEKLVEEKKPPSMVARTANQVAAMYAALVEEMKDFQGKSILDRNWAGLVAVKAKLFASLAQYYRALADAAKHGTALVRLKLADALAADAARLAASFAYGFVAQHSPTLPHDAGTSIVEITKAHAALCAEARAQAVKDNDLIYHDILPSEAALPAIEKLAPAAPVTIQEVYGNPDVSKLIGPDIFARLVPLAVHESASVYSEEKAKLVRGEVERVDVSEGEVRAGLESMGLPALVAQWRALAEGDEQEIEPSARVTSVQIGPVDLARLEQERTRFERELRELGSTLDGESRDCERMRAKYAPQFTQAPSGPLAAHLRATITSNLGSLSAAAASDAELLTLWSEVQADAALVQAGPDALRRAAQQAAVGKVDPSVSLLDVDDAPGLAEGEREELRRAAAEAAERLDRLAKVRRERDDTLKDLKEKIQNDDVSNLLLLNRRSPNETQLFQTELEKFRPYQGRLAAAIAASQSILDELSAIEERVSKGRGMRERQRTEREGRRRLAAWEARIERAGQVHAEVVAGLGKGLAFYESLAHVVSQLKDEVARFVGGRERERSRMVGEIETRQRLAAGAGAPSPSPPPPPAGQRSLDAQLGAMAISQPYSPSAPAAPASPAYPPPPPHASTPSYLPPPPGRSAYPPPSAAYPPQPVPSSSAYPAPPAAAKPTSPYASPPPSQPVYDPFDFGQLSSLPSAFSTQPAAPPMPSAPPAPPQSRPSAPSYAPPPSAIYQSPPPSAGYQSPPPASRPSDPYASYGHAPPPPPSQYTQHTQQTHAPYPPPPSALPPSAYGAPSQPAYPAPPARPTYGSPSYPAPPSGYAPPPPTHYQPHQPTFPAAPSAPPSQPPAQYPHYPPPGGQPGYPAHPGQQGYPYR